MSGNATWISFWFYFVFLRTLQRVQSPGVNSICQTKQTPGACLKHAFCEMCFTVFAEFLPNWGYIADYADKIRNTFPQSSKCCLRNDFTHFCVKTITCPARVCFLTNSPPDTFSIDPLFYFFFTFPENNLYFLSISCKTVSVFFSFPVK